MKRKILQFLLKRLYLAPTDKDFVEIKNNILYKNNKPIGAELTKNYKAQARGMKEFTLYQDIISQLRYKATQSIYYKSGNIDDIIFGKVLLYVIELIENKINTLAK